MLGTLTVLIQVSRERAKEMQPPGQESIAILIDYRGTTMRTNPSISVARKVLTILQNHYVETLGRGLVVFLPMLLNFFYKGISPFLGLFLPAHDRSPS